MMWTITSFIIITAAIIYSTASEEEKVFQVAGIDSYLDAYRKSQEAHVDKSTQKVKGVVKISDREFTEWNPSYPPSGPQ